MFYLKTILLSLYIIIIIVIINKFVTRLRFENINNLFNKQKDKFVLNNTIRSLNENWIITNNYNNYYNNGFILNYGTIYIYIYI